MTTKVQGATFRYSHTIGRGEEAGTGFKNPVSVARGEGDLMYVVSRAYDYRSDSKRITVCTVGEDYIGEIGNAGRLGGEMMDSGESDAPGSMVWPTSVALDKAGNVYVSDEWLNRIAMFSSDGEWLGAWGTQGDADGEVDQPAGIAFDSEDNLYVVDTGNNRIQKFTKDGQFLAKWGQQGSGDGEFDMPWGIGLDADNNVYIADWRNDRIQKFAPDGSFLMAFGASGSEDGQFNRPADVAVDKEVLIYVADWRNDRVQVFDAEGRFITEIIGDATLSKWGITKLDANPDMKMQRDIAQGLEREKFLRGPMGVVVDDQDQVFIVDSQRNRIQIYRKIPPFFVGLYDGGRL
ncbi:MAG: SMP-30/gluconolactonase/LRE family protein [Dehalococcoidia bacterium]|nr:SMP-30/gluconolactonase/LRE family protein [Dehalococcoidia bacterium]